MKKSTFVPVLLGSALVVVSALVPEMAFATDSAAATAIDTAISDGTALLAKVAPGIITIAGLMTGVALVISFIRK
ncbi:hypothetical protein [Methylovulum miyakonense]|uniref:hypothetical protein n=1 Tax=Methylovulum miyakonense TaxID=645578 RepID=UPI0003665C9A|nr:hypothetical protein [Methylovulum miyakonense]